MDMQDKTPLECFYHWEQNTPDWIFLRQPKNLVWREYTWREVADHVRRIASYINAQELPAGSRIGLWSGNSADWVLVDLAIMLSGHISVPIYAGQDVKSANYILDHAECELLFVGLAEQQAALVNGDITRQVPRIAMLGAQIPCETSLDDIISTYEPFLGSPLPNPMDIMTIIYTSGTTGNPKGVMHFHGTAGKVIPRMLRKFNRTNEPERERYFSFLPLSHIAERVAVEFVAIYLNPTLSFSEGLATFAAELHSVKPTFFFAVPRLWAKFKAAVDAKVPPAMQAHLGPEQKAMIADQLGLDKATMIVTGSAPTPKDIHQWFIDMGIMLRDAYGMTENFVDGCMYTDPGLPIPGCVGKPIVGVDVKISEDGEILFKSEGVMPGYYKEPEKTAEVIIDGWYHTGDLGRIDEHGNLWITGRMSETFKTTKGKFVQPAQLENLFGRIRLLGQFLVLGHAKDQPILLSNLSEFARASGLDQATMSDMIGSELAAINEALPAHEKVAQILITQNDWSVESGLSTPTFKLKRKQVENHYADFIERAAGAGPVVWE